MGSWFASLFESQGLSVSSAGKRTGLNPATVARECEVVIVSVPITDTIKVIKELGPLVREDGLIMDLTSIKKGPVEAMLKYSRAEVLGAHPLFGPEEEEAEGQKVVICPGRGEEWSKWFTGILDKAGVKIVKMDPEKHDRLMGLIQGVNHFSTLALALCIERSGFGLEEISNCTTRSFNQKFDRIKSMLKQSPELFESLIMDNPEAGEFIEQYYDSADKMIRVARERDREAFKEIFNSLKDFLET
jgi:prephenate dehydrogenase